MARSVAGTVMGSAEYIGSLALASQTPMRGGEVPDERVKTPRRERQLVPKWDASITFFVMAYKVRGGP